MLIEFIIVAFDVLVDVRKGFVSMLWRDTTSGDDGESNNRCALARRVTETFKGYACSRTPSVSGRSHVTQLATEILYILRQMTLMSVISYCNGY